ncbi:MAG TPA: sodium:solute symporter [Vicinamibacterales bacterium]|nr:sodium:solute symporter [Vicinamibacterales bacterium]
MRWLDWVVVVAYLVWIVWDGLARSKRTNEVEGYFLANRSLPWWAVGLSVMATQLSAITLVGTTGQGAADGMRFVQFYFGLPIAMIILSLTVVPFFYRARVYTAYEYLEQRFDVKTRTLAALLFLASRGLSCGAVIAAPAVILSIVLGWNLTLTVLLIGLPTAVYTMAGGVQAVTWTDVKQMGVIVAGVFAAVGVLIAALPSDIGTLDALRVAGTAGRMETIDLSFDLRETYTFWSGMIGGLFLMLSYFGCDQSQVQRYLTAKSVDEGRHSLLMSAFVKIPLQTVILGTGALVFAFFVFEPPPLIFNPQKEEAVRKSDRASEFAGFERQFATAVAARSAAARELVAARRGDDPVREEEARARFARSGDELTALRRRAAVIVRDVTDDEGYGRFTGDMPASDVNYIFPMFVTRYLPIGLVGLIIAAILAAAMSTIAAELNSLATATVIDVYRRHFKPVAPDAHYLVVSRSATAFWGLFACVVATYATSLGSLIEVVNRFGSLFYGSLLGVFILAIGARRAVSAGAFWGLLAGLAAVITVAAHPATRSISFLWHNVVGVVVVVTVGMTISLLAPRRAQ